MKLRFEVYKIFCVIRRTLDALPPEQRGPLHGIPIRRGVVFFRSAYPSALPSPLPLVEVIIRQKKNQFHLSQFLQMGPVTGIVTL
jgi:hypothetical protein